MISGIFELIAFYVKIAVCLFQVCYARVLDYRRKFIEAAQRYNELSYKSVVAEAERMTALKNALICTILASAGTCGTHRAQSCWQHFTSSGSLVK